MENEGKQKHSSVLGGGVIHKVALKNPLCRDSENAMGPQLAHRRLITCERELLEYGTNCGVFEIAIAKKRTSGTVVKTLYLGYLVTSAFAGSKGAGQD